MKKVFPLVLALLIPFRPEFSYENFRGIVSHELYPFPVNQPFHISVPFYFDTATTLTYEYVIFNSKGAVTYTAPQVTRDIRAKFNYFVTHSGTSSQFSLGRNYMRLFYKLNNEPWKTYYGYFFGYNAVSGININDGGNGSTLLSNEARFSYFEQSNSGIVELMYFDTAPFKSLYTLEHDLYFNLNNLTTTFLNFERSFSYDGVRVSFSDYNLFPKLPTLAGKKVVHLSMDYANNKITFKPRYQLYVDPKTHIISYEKEPGFIIADKIYFPRDKYELVNHAEVSMVITNFSYGGFTLNYYFQLNVLNKYFGDGGLYQIEIERH